MLILGSKSPRRQELLRGLGIEFEVRTKNTVESYPSTVPAHEVPGYIAKLKAAAFADLQPEDTLITADTVVIVDNEILGKPDSRDEAFEMLKKLQDHTHQVVTGVCIRHGEKTISFCDETIVHFCPMTDDEIYYYIDNYRPYDKAGAYGVQEWIGYVAVDRIEGSYFNVMGLPIHKVYQELKTI
mgnify:CR=1 FL=1